MTRSDLIILAIIAAGTVLEIIQLALHGWDIDAVMYEEEE